MAQNVAALADTFPKLLIRNAHLYGARPSMRHKDLGIWQTWTWARGARDRARLCGRPAPARPQARRDHRHRRRQPAEALLVGDGGADARRRPGAGLCRRGGRRTLLRAGPCRGALRRGRGPGAGRQDPVGAGAAAEARADGLRREARPARLRPQPACMRWTTSSRTAARRSPIRRSAPGSMPRSPPARAPIRRSSSTPPAPPAPPRAWCSPANARSTRPPTPSPSTS